MKYFNNICLGLITLAMLVLVLDLRATLASVRASLVVINTSVMSITAQVTPALADIHNIQIDTTRTESEMAGLLNATRHSMLTPVQVASLVGGANKVLTDTDTTILRLNDTVTELATLTPVTEQVIRNVGNEAQSTLGVAQGVLATANADLCDTRITKVEDNLITTSTNVVGITDDIHTESMLVVGKTQEAFKPQNKFLSISKGLLGGTLTAAELFYYLSH